MVDTMRAREKGMAILGVLLGLVAFAWALGDQPS
jgi:hypothetical protein